VGKYGRASQVTDDKNKAAHALFMLSN
jgi:hypothetical protein